MVRSYSYFRAKIFQIKDVLVLKKFIIDQIKYGSFLWGFHSILILIKQIGQIEYKYAKC